MTASRHIACSTPPYGTAGIDLLAHALAVAVAVVIALNAALSGRLLSKAWDK